MRLATMLSIAVVSTVVASASAEALCTQSGAVSSVFVQPGLGLSTVFLKPSGQTANVVWFGLTSVAKMISAATAALTAQTRVAMTGNAASCPTTGVNRNIGTLVVISLNP